jgi:hypothetical protein
MFFGDYVNGDIHRATLDEAREHVVRAEVIASAPDLALSLEVGPEGAIYFSSYIAIFRLELRGGPASPSSTSPPPPTTDPTPAPSSAVAAPDGPSDGDGGWNPLAIAAVAFIGAGSLAALVIARRRRRRESGGPTGP